MGQKAGERGEHVCQLWIEQHERFELKQEERRQKSIMDMTKHRYER